MEELLNALEATNNVSRLEYDPEVDEWTVYYKNGFNPDGVYSHELIDFLRNA
jgi:hypothetical protein